MIFRMFDKKANTYSKPFTSLNKMTVTRDIQSGIGDDDPHRTYADDYALYLVGEFEDELPDLTPVDPEQIFALSEILTKE